MKRTGVKKTGGEWAGRGRVWRVTRFCCAGGQCVECHRRAERAGRERVVHADHLTEAAARTTAAGWRSHDAVAELMAAR